jgi:hypothetical protein
MDRTEVVVCKANGETYFRDFREHWLFGINKAKMVTIGGLGIHYQKASKLSKEWGEGQ